MKLNPAIPLLALATFSAATPAAQLPVGLDLGKEPDSSKVNVSLYVMSKCPDAVRTLIPLGEGLIKTEGNILIERMPTIETV